MPEPRKDVVVVDALKDWTCAGCGADDHRWLRMDDAGPLCLDCADLGHLVYLPRGDAALSRRARKSSALAAVVVRFSRARKRYERQGILIEESALELAEEQCLADADARSRRAERNRERSATEDVAFQHAFADEIVRLFPSCPLERAAAIGRHAGARGSGRVGRSASGRALDAQAVTLAVVASVRHGDTDYDELLMTGVPRDAARDKVSDDVASTLDAWRSAPNT